MVTSESVSESNENLIGFIASTAEKLRDDVATMSEQMVTKEDLARLEGRFTERLETSITDVRAESKGDLARLEGRLTERMAVSFTAIRGDLEQIQLRLDSMEHSIASRFRACRR